MEWSTSQLVHFVPSPALISVSTSSPGAHSHTITGQFANTTLQGILHLLDKIYASPVLALLRMSNHADYTYSEQYTFVLSQSSLVYRELYICTCEIFYLFFAPCPRCAYYIGLISPTNPIPVYKGGNHHPHPPLPNHTSKLHMRKPAA